MHKKGDSTHIRLPRNRPPTHPGQMLLKEFMKPHGVSVERLAFEIKVSKDDVEAVISGYVPITNNLAHRFAYFFGNTPEFWLNGQKNWNGWQAKQASGGIKE